MSFDAQDYLNYFGFERIKNHDDENMMASCFQWEMHTNDDRKRSFGMRKDTGLANCYVCGGWSLEGLTKELLNRKAEFEGTGQFFNEFDALKFLEEKNWLPDEDSIDDLKEQFAGMDGIEFKTVKEEDTTKYLDDSVLDEYKKSMHKRTLQRGNTKDAISIEMARFFELGYDKQTKRIIIPVREEKGRLVGVTSRATLEDDFIRYGIGTINPAWRLSQIQNRYFDGDKMLYVFDKRNYVFGEHLWYKTNEYGKRVLRHDQLLVLESPLDVVYAWSQGLQEYMNIGAIFGSKCTKEQMAKILRHHYVVEALDNDKGGIEGRESFHKNAEDKCELYTCDNYGKKDLGDCTPLEVQAIVSRFKLHGEDIFAGLEEQL
jgi:hypothetical protein